MGRYKKGREGILETPSGKVGPVIFYEWNGIGCVRMMPQSYRDARTEVQLCNRSKLKALMAFESSMTGALRNGFRWVADETTEVNEATRINFKSAMQTEGTSAWVEYSQAYVSWGSLPGLIGLQWLVANGKVLVCWESAECFDDTDLICMALYDEDKGCAKWDLTCGKRGDLGCEMGVPEEWIGDRVHCWIWVNGKGRNSTSQYLGEFRIENSEFRVGTGADFEASAGDLVTTLPPPKCYKSGTRPIDEVGLKSGFEGSNLGVGGRDSPPD